MGRLWRSGGAAVTLVTTKFWLLDFLENAKDKATHDDNKTWDDVARFDKAIRLVEQGPEEPRP